MWRKRKTSKEKNEGVSSSPGGRKLKNNKKNDIVNYNNSINGEEQEQVEEEEKGKGRFFGCYLLTSLSPRHKGHTYIGFAVNPKRRVRQHNGEIGMGAWRTKRKRPWEMVLCIYGFPTNVSALQFEWAWQHPIESLVVREAAASFKSLSGVANKIKLAFTMLTLSKWQNLDLTVNFFSSKYSNHSAGCPTLPEQMRVQVCSMDELPCYTGICNMNEDEDRYKDDLDTNDSVDELFTTDSSVKDRSMNIPFESDMYNCTSNEKTTTTYGRTEDENMHKSEDFIWTEDGNLLNFSNDVDLFDWTNENIRAEDLTEDVDRFNFVKGKSAGLDQPNIKESGGEDDTMRSEDLFNFVEDDDTINLVNEKTKYEMTTSRDACNDEFVANSPIISHEVEVIDLLSPSPGYRVDLRTKRRKVASGIIDLTKSPIFVQV